MSIIEFRRLIKKLQQHNISALQDIYDNFFSKIYYFALSKVKSEQDAYDIAMGVIVKLTEYKGDVQEIKNHIGLMITMTQNMVNDYYRRRRRLVFYEPEKIRGGQPYETSLWFTVILNNLTEAERTVLLDHILWGITLKNCAKRLKISYSSVRRIYYSVKKIIKKLYIE